MYSSQVGENMTRPICTVTRTNACSVDLSGENKKRKHFRMEEKNERLVDQVRQLSLRYSDETPPVPHLVKKHATKEEYEYVVQHTRNDVHRIQWINGDIFVTFCETRAHGGTVGWITTEIFAAWHSNCSREGWRAVQNMTTSAVQWVRNSRNPDGSLELKNGDKRSLFLIVEVNFHGSSTRAFVRKLHDWINNTASILEVIGVDLRGNSLESFEVRLYHLRKNKNTGGVIEVANNVLVDDDTILEIRSLPFEEVGINTNMDRNDDEFAGLELALRTWIRQNDRILSVPLAGLPDVARELFGEYLLARTSN